jgi:3-dehydroquinate dehydratase-2
MAGKIALINGPNLNMLGSRDTEIYGSDTLGSIIDTLTAYAEQAQYELVAVQSNLEGEVINAIHEAINSCSGIIINPGGYSHTSIAIRDAVEIASVPVVEVHLSNIYAREEFRQHSFVSEVADGVIAGLGSHGYILAFGALLQLIKNKA